MGSGTGSAGAVLALDQGTTNSKALLVDLADGRVLSTGSSPVAVDYPRPGWVEQDAEQLWRSTVEAVVRCLGAAPEGVLPVAVSLSNQRESVVAWDRRDGRPVGPVLGWQDARTAADCRRLDADADAVRSRTGLPLDPMFSAPKLRRLADHARDAGVPAGDLRLGTVDAWIVHRLTGSHVTEAGNASRTLLLDLRTLAWGDDLVDLFGVPREALPRVVASDAGFGTTTGSDGVPAGLPVVAVLADSHAALYHHGRGRPGAGKATYGTGSSVMTPTELTPTLPLEVATTLAWLTDAPVYAREGNVVATGAALDWAARLLGVPEGRSGGAFLTDLAHGVPDAGGVEFVPAFSGLGSPYWDRRATGVITGVTAGVRPAHVARAALDAVAHQVADVLDAVEADGRARVEELFVDGGATASDLLMQVQADVLGRPVTVAGTPEASALGAAALAARTLGAPPWPSTRGRRVEPAVAQDERARRRRSWAVAVARSRGLAVSPAATPDPDAAPERSTIR